MGNLITAASILVGALLIIVMYAQGATVAVEYYTSVRMIGGTLSLFEEVSLAVFFVPTCFVICAVAATILQIMLTGLGEVWDAKIAKCERKDGDDPNEST